MIDFVVCLGGDGVILHACTLFHSYVPPIIGFNLGSMGFLTNHEFETFREDLRGVMQGGDQLDGCDTDDPDQGGVYVTLRMRLLCEVYRRGQQEPSEVHEVLNEVVVDRGSSPYLSKIECYERGRLVTRVQVWWWWTTIALVFNNYHAPKRTRTTGTLKNNKSTPTHNRLMVCCSPHPRALQHTVSQQVGAWHTHPCLPFCLHPYVHIPCLFGL